MQTTGWMESKNGKKCREMSGQDISLRECFCWEDKCVKEFWMHNTHTEMRSMSQVVGVVVDTHWNVTEMWSDSYNLEGTDVNFGKGVGNNLTIHCWSKL